MAEDKKFPHDETFPENVNPTEENRKNWSDQREKEIQEEREAAENDRPVSEDEGREPQTKTGQTKTTSGKK